jgi:hypothetical protein
MGEHYWEWSGAEARSQSTAGWLTTEIASSGCRDRIAHGDFTGSATRRPATTRKAYFGRPVPSHFRAERER